MFKNPKTGKMFPAKSAEAEQYIGDFCRQVKRPKEPLTGTVRLTATIYYRSFRSDVSDELLCDCIQTAGLVKNDRQIRLKIIDGTRVDKKNPRVEFFIEEVNS